MLSKISVKKPFTVVVAVIIVIILGVVSYLKLGVDLLPEMELPYVVVMTTYPGASPDQVDQDVTKPLEGALASVSGLKTLSSVSNENYSMIIMEFAASMNMDSAMIELSSYVDSASAAFADGVGAPTLLRINPSMLPVMLMTADKDGMDEAEFTTYVEEELQPALERIEGVASVSLMGAVQEQVEITWKQEAIDELNRRILESIDSGLADAQRELDKSRAEIRRGKKELEDKSASAYDELSALSSQMSDGHLQLQLGLNALEQTPAELEAKKQELLSTKESLKGLYELLAAKEELEDGIDQMEDGLEQLAEAEDQLDESYTALYEQKQRLRIAIAAYGANANETTTTALIDELLASGKLLAGLAEDMAELGEGMGMDGGMGGGMDGMDMSAMLQYLNRDTLTMLFAFQPQQGLAMAQQLLDGLDQGAEALDEAQKELTDQKEELKDAYNQLLQYQSQMSSALSQAGDMDEEDLDEAIEQIDEGIEQIDKALAELPGTKSDLQQSLDELKDGQTELEKGKMELSTQLSSAAVQLAMGEAQLDTAYAQFEEARDEAFRNAGLDGVLTTDMLSSILNACNFSMPAGYLGQEEEQTLVKVGDKFASLEELENLLLLDMEVADIGSVYLYDVADIQLSDNSGEYYARVNGNPGLIISMSKQSMYSTNEVSKSINQTMEELMAAEEGLHLVALSDQGYYIRMAISAVLNNLLLGAALAILILILFLRSIRPTLVIALSIPISLLGALALMYFSGVSINVISLAGLATGVGMLVDNSIVTIENIYRLRSLGVPPATAAVRGAGQIAGAIISSTLTTVCVFLPIVFTNGLSRQLFSDMGLTVAYSLLASLLVALSLVPMLASQVLTKPLKKETKLFSRFISAYGKLLAWTLRHKWAIFLPVLALMLLALLSVARMGTGLIPEVDYGQVTVSLRAPENQEMSQEELQELADELTTQVLEIEGVTMVGSFEGALGGASLAGLGGGGSSSSGEDYQLSLYVLCDYDAGLTGREASRQLRQLCAELPADCQVESASMDMTAMMGSGIQVNLLGEDGGALAELAAEVSQRLSQVEGVGEISDGLDDTAPELRIQVNKNAAMRQGLTVAQVYMELASALRQETQAMTLSLEDKDYPVVIVSDPEQALDEQKLKDHLFTVTKTNAEGKSEESTLHLSSIAQISRGEGLASVNRLDQQRYHSISADVAEGYNIGLVGADVEDALSELEMPAGYRWELSGENESINDALSDLLLMIGLAVVFIYLIMVAQFQDLLLPFIVLTTIPLAFTGGLLTLLLLGQEVSIIAMLGFLLLAGIIVNNGIVFIDCVNQLRLDEGLEKREALVKAGQMRMRPILMTALTTIFGLGSMAFSQQMGSELLRPLALVTVGGMIYATALTLLFVPAFYDVLQRRPLRRVEILDDEAAEALENRGEEKTRHELTTAETATAAAAAETSESAAANAIAPQPSWLEVAPFPEEEASPRTTDEQQDEFRF